MTNQESLNKALSACESLLKAIDNNEYLGIMAEAAENTYRIIETYGTVVMDNLIPEPGFSDMDLYFERDNYNDCMGELSRTVLGYKYNILPYCRRNRLYDIFLQVNLSLQRVSEMFKNGEILVWDE